MANSLPIEGGIKVRVNSSTQASYIATLPVMPVYYDGFQHTPTSPMINVQSVVYSPGDADAIVTITVG